MKTNYEDYKKKTILNVENQLQWSMKKLMEAEWESDADKLDALDFLTEAKEHIMLMWKFE